MSIARDAIYDALFNLVKTALGSNVKTIGRRHMMPPILTTAMQPAAFVVQGPEEHSKKPRGAPGMVTLHGFIIAYYYDNSANADGSTGLNILIGEIEDAIAATTKSPIDGSDVQTLGGLVSHCWIEGTADVDPGVFGQQAVAVLPVHMLVPRTTP